MKKILQLGMLITLIFSLFACKGNNNPKVNEIDNPFELFSNSFKGDWNKPGLYEKDGSAHKMPTPIIRTGVKINVVDYGARPNEPTFDNYEYFRQAIADAQAGDQVYIPEGKFYFTRHTSVGGYNTHINLKSNILLAGAGEDKTILVSKFSEKNNLETSTSVITVINNKNVTISDLTITSNTDDNVLPDNTNSSLQSGIYTAPKYGITLDTTIMSASVEDSTQNVLIKDVTVEKFQRMGIRISLSLNNTIDNCTFQKAVNLGGGGAGYGVTIQGKGSKANYTDRANDTLFNVVKNSEFKGPWLRHGVIVQYYAHNNLFTGNTFEDILLDAMDLHGEDEYSNEISHNTFINTRKGAGIGVGNSGATHAAAGRNNLIHHNTIDGGLRGIDIILGSPKTFVFRNTIKNLTEGRTLGIYLSKAPDTHIIDNVIDNIKSSDKGFGMGIKVEYAFDAINPSSGIPRGIDINYNTIKNCTLGLFVETYDSTFKVNNMTYVGNTKDYETNHTGFILPEKSSLMDVKTGFEVLPTDNIYISTEHRDSGSFQKNMKLKSSLTEPHFNRMIYTRFDLSEINKANYNKVYLAFAAKAQLAFPTINIWGTTTYTNWTQGTLTWNNAKLHNENIGMLEAQDEIVLKIIDFHFPLSVYDFNTYYLDITEYIMTRLDGDVFTMIFSNDAIEEVYVEIYNKEETTGNKHLRLVFATE